MHLQWDNPKMQMNRRKWIGLVVIVLLLGASAFGVYQKWRTPKVSAREELLARMPEDANAIIFINFYELRSAPILAQLYASAPKPQADPEYAQFLKDTGFDYERDLDLIAIAYFKNTVHPTFFAAATGQFDQRKISAYALQHGKAESLRTKSGERKVFFVPLSDGSGEISFAFPRPDQIVITNDTVRVDLIKDGPPLEAMRTDWRTRFERLAGSPVFVVVRQDAAIGDALAAQAPGGLRSPQLSTLLDQLQWITVAGRAENDSLRIVAEGECTADATVRQLVDLMNGVVIMAQMGLNDAKTRQQLDPAARKAYLELLNGVDVSKIDRGDTKSVRLVFDVTPSFLEAARQIPQGAPDSRTAKPQSGKPPARKGRT
jgi:hypothetical protein